MIRLSFMYFRLKFKIFFYTGIFIICGFAFLFVGKHNVQAVTKCLLPGSAGCSTYSYEGLLRWPADCRAGSQRAVRVNLGRQYGSVCDNCGDGDCKRSGGGAPTKQVATFYRDAPFQAGSGWAFVGVWIAGTDYEGNMYYWLYKGWAGNGRSSPNKIEGVTTSGNGQGCPGGNYGVNFSAQKCGGSSSTCFLKSEEYSKCPPRSDGQDKYFYRNPWDGYGHICEYFDDPMSSCTDSVCGVSRNKWQRSIWDAQSLIVNSVWDGLNVNTYGVWFAGGSRKRWYGLEGTAYELYCQIPNQGPSVTLNSYNSCYSNPRGERINVTFSDVDGWNDLSRIGIRLIGRDINGAEQFNIPYCGRPVQVGSYITISGSENAACPWLGAEVDPYFNRMELSPSGNDISGYFELGSGIGNDITWMDIELYAEDQSGASTGWVSQGSMYKNPEIGGVRIEGTNLEWDVEYASSCRVSLVGCSMQGGCRNNCNVNCSAGSVPIVLPSEGTCQATLVATNDGCSDSESTSLEVITANWLMSEYGDTFARNGYSDMELGETTGSLATTYPPPNYFSRYIISSSNSTLTSERESRKGYDLVDYPDQNISKFAPTVYNYLLGIVKPAPTDLTSWPPPVDGVYRYNGGAIGAGAVCGVKAVIFVPGDLSITPPFSISPAGSDNGCLFIVQGNVSINGGGSTVEAYFVSDQGFSTNGADTLIIKGGVITRRSTFQASGSGGNPGEIIHYDARYLDILRDYLGEEYPYKLREWKYSS
jgi:hypothetical protein